MKFTVHVMPPPRHRPPATPARNRPVSTTSPFGPVAHTDKPLKTISIPIDPELNFDALWKETEQRFRRNCDKDKIAGMYVSHLQDLEGGTIFVTDKIGSMYPKDGLATERQIYMCMEDVDREGTIPPGSEMRPQGFKKRRWADLDEAEQAILKRRRAEEERYGATINELDPDTPVMSREVGSEDLAGMDSTHSAESTEGDRVDADGFKIPAKPAKSSQKPKPLTVCKSNPAVLVYSSQEDLPTPDSTDRRLGGSTPPSAQRSPRSPDTDEIIASSQGPRHAFELLNKKIHGSSKRQGSSRKITWSPAEDDILRQGIRENWCCKEISGALSGRSEGAVRARKKLLLEANKLYLRPRHASKNSQTLELSSSPPIASGSTVPQSSPCEAAALAERQSPGTAPGQGPKQQSVCKGSIGWMKLPSLPKPVRNVSPPVSEPTTEPASESVIDPVVEPATRPLPVAERSFGQPATPPESHTSETSTGKLRAPRCTLSAAARLRESRERVKNALKQPRVRTGVERQTDHVTEVPPIEVSISEDSEIPSALPAALDAPADHEVAVLHSDADQIAGGAEHSCGADVSEVPNVPEGHEVLEEAQKPPMLEKHAQAPQTPDVPQVTRVELNHQKLDQAVPEITLPQRKKNRIYRNLSDKQRWKDALNVAKGDRTRAQHIFVIELNKEDMLDAVASDDKAEIERLKAQRRRLEREMAVANGLSPPKRRVPNSFSSIESSKMAKEDADEEVIRDDDWTTDEEVALKEDYEDYEEEKEDVVSSDGEEFCDVEAKLEGPRVIEMPVTPSPPPAPAEKTEEKAPRPNPAPSSASEMSDKRRRNRRKSRISETTSRHDSSSTAAPPAAPPAAAAAAAPTPAPKHRYRNIIDPPKRRLTREEAVAAHLAECKRREEMYLHNGDDDDDDDSSSTSSS